LLERLSLPQPPFYIVHSRAELAALDHFPCYLKTNYSTAGQGVWHVRDREERDRVALTLEQQGLLGGTHAIVVQHEVSGVLCQAQAVFAQGHLCAVHCTQTRGVSVGGGHATRQQIDCALRSELHPIGGHAARLGVDHPTVREHLAILGKVLAWHGPLALDYLVDPTTGQPAYLECNPRLVEPMNATLSGVNLADLTVRVALGEEEASNDLHRGQSGLRSHSLLAILLGVADHGGSRRQLLQTIVQDLWGRGIFAGSQEDLTLPRLDPLSLIPLSVVTAQLLINPHAASHIATGSVGAYSLSPAAIETILAMDRT
jgi:hypothetical protein